jgi:hypothetical protein
MKTQKLERVRGSGNVFRDLLGSRVEVKIRVRRAEAVVQEARP